MQKEQVSGLLPSEEGEEKQEELSPLSLVQLSSSYWASKAFASAVELNLFTELADQPLPLSKIEKHLNLSPRPTQMILTACIGFGLLQIKDGEYSNTPLAQKFLVKGKPDYFGDAVKMIDRRLYPAWGNLTEGLKTNRPQDYKKLESNFEARYSDREEKRLFLECMHGISVESGRQLAHAVDFSQFSQILDVGGGTGAYCIEILRRFPHLKAVVFDLPPALQIAYEKIFAAGYSKIIQTYPGDFFLEKLPIGSDVILISMVLHGCTPEQALGPLKKCFEALPDGGAIIVTDLILDDDKTGPVPAALMSLNMLIETEGGRSYSWKEYSEWMNEAGFVDIQRLKMESPGTNGALMGRKPGQALLKKNIKENFDKKSAFLPELEPEIKKEELSCASLMQLATAFWPSKTLAAAIDLDLFTELAEKPLSFEEVLRHLKLHPRPGEMLLTACVSLGLLQKKEGKFENSTLAQGYLVRGKPTFFGDAMKIMDKRLYPLWGKLTEAIKTNQSQNLENPDPSYNDLYADRLDKRLFLEGLYGINLQAGRKLAETIDFSPFHKLIDLGGGAGAYCLALARRYPQLQVMLFDLPQALSIAHEKITAAGFSKIIDLYPGDFFNERLPSGCDVILISNVLQDWSPDKNLIILKKCHEALPVGGTVIINQTMMDDDKTGPLFAALLSLNLLLESGGGQNYSWQEIEGWMEKTGFGKIRRIRIDSPSANGVIVGIKKDLKDL